MNSGIYQIRHKATGRVYIGSTINIRARFKRHRADLRVGQHHCIHLQRAWRKHGADAFAFESVRPVSDPSWLLVNEQAYIDATARNGLIYNTCRTAGNCLGVKQSEETKNKRADKIRGRKCSGETKRLISIKAKARGTPKAFARLMEIASQRRFRLNREQAERAAALHADGKQWADVAKSFGTGPKAFRRAMREAGFDLTLFPPAASARVYLRGAQHPMSKLSEDDIRYIRASGASLRALADKFGLNYSYVCDIRKGRSWAHVGAQARRP